MCMHRTAAATCLMLHLYSGAACPQLQGCQIPNTKHQSRATGSLTLHVGGELCGKVYYAPTALGTSHIDSCIRRMYMLLQCAHSSALGNGKAAYCACHARFVLQLLTCACATQQSVGTDSAQHCKAAKLHWMASHHWQRCSCKAKACHPVISTLFVCAPGLCGCHKPLRSTRPLFSARMRR